MKVRIGFSVFHIACFGVCKRLTMTLATQTGSNERERQRGRGRLPMVCVCFVLLCVFFFYFTVAARKESRTEYIRRVTNCGGGLDDKAGTMHMGQAKFTGGKYGNQEPGKLGGRD